MIRRRTGHSFVWFVTLFALVIGVHSLVMGSVLLIPSFPAAHATSTFLLLFEHQYALWALAAIYLVSSIFIIFGAATKNIKVIRAGLLLYILVGFYRIIGAFLISGPWPIHWFGILVLVVVAIIAWLVYDDVETWQ